MHFGFFTERHGVSEVINYVDQEWLLYGPERCLALLKYFASVE